MGKLRVRGLARRSGARAEEIGVTLAGGKGSMSQQLGSTKVMSPASPFLTIDIDIRKGGPSTDSTAYPVFPDD